MALERKGHMDGSNVYYAIPGTTTRPGCFVSYARNIVDFENGRLGMRGKDV